MQTCCVQNTQCETGAAKMDAYERVFPQRAVGNCLAFTQRWKPSRASQLGD